MVFDPPERGTPIDWGDPADQLTSRPRPTDPRVDVQCYLPFDFGRQSFYPVHAGEPAVFRLNMAIGIGDPTDAARAVVLVEGRPVDVLVGDRVPHVDLDLSEGIGTAEITIPADVLGTGLNRVDVALFLSRRGGRRLLMGPAFTIANGSLEPAPFVETPGLEEGPYVPGERTQVYRTSLMTPELGEIYFPQWVPAAAPLDDPTRVIVRMQASSPWSACDPENEDQMVILAFRDMEPVPMGGLERVAVSIPAGEQRVFRFELPLFPEDGMQHHYALALMGGFGRPARSVDGARGPWLITRDLLQVFWGWDPDE